MNIGHVGNKGGVGPAGESPVRTGPGSGGRAADGSPDAGDLAAISADGREAKASFDARVAAARQDDDRSDRVARAIQRLISGELDRDEVYADVAQKVLADGFRAV